MELIIIVPELSKKVDIRKIQKQIVSYAGTRLVDQTFDLNVMPGVALNEPLPQIDKATLSELMQDQGVLLFIEINKDEDYSENYLCAKAIPREK